MKIYVKLWLLLKTDIDKKTEPLVELYVPFSFVIISIDFHFYDFVLHGLIFFTY